jgi:homopolymeric O-antigen transport system permease protein
MPDAQLSTPAATQAPAFPPLESAEVRRIVPTKRRAKLIDFYRDFPVIQVLAARDFKVKYKQSLLGPLWLFFQPLALLAGFLVAFRGLADVQSGTPYVPFAMVGLSVWAFFQAAMTMGTSAFITNFMLVRFTPCPRLAFPVAGLIASVPSFVVTIVGAFIAAAITGVLSPKGLLMPFGFLWLFLLTAGMVAITASLAVRYRDIISALPFFLQVGLFLAPVGYPLSELGPTVRAILDFNPLTGLMEAWRWMVLADYTPSFEPIGISLAMTPLIVLLGWRVFSRMETTMADEI